SASFTSVTSNRRYSAAAKIPSALPATIRAVRMSSTPALPGSTASCSSLGTVCSPASLDLRGTRGELAPSAPVWFRISQISDGVDPVDEHCGLALHAGRGPVLNAPEEYSNAIPARHESPESTD